MTVTTTAAKSSRYRNSEEWSRVATISLICMLVLVWTGMRDVVGFDWRRRLAFVSLVCVCRVDKSFGLT